MLLAILLQAGLAAGASIDRHALVSRHNPSLRAFDTSAPLSVGNGDFAFTADATGLQTFPAAYEGEIPLGTLAQWGWHSSPNPDGFSIDRFRFEEFDSHGRRVGYADIPGDRRTPEIEWLRRNPHRLHLGQLGFYLTAVDELVKDPIDGPTIGLLLCKSRNEIVAEYALRDNTKPLGVAEYQLIEALPDALQTALPSIEQIERELAG